MRVAFAELFKQVEVSGAFNAGEDERFEGGGFFMLVKELEVFLGEVEHVAWFFEKKRGHEVVEHLPDFGVGFDVRRMFSLNVFLGLLLEGFKLRVQVLLHSVVVNLELRSLNKCYKTKDFHTAADLFKQKQHMCTNRKALYDMA